MVFSKEFNVLFTALFRHNMAFIRSIDPYSDGTMNAYMMRLRVKNWGWVVFDGVRCNLAGYWEEGANGKN